VRGDSIRDFYAKALAVTGLGLLAGVGALVDYWPAPLGVPHTPSVATRFGAVGPLTVALPSEFPITIDRPRSAPRAVLASLSVSTSEAAQAVLVTNAVMEEPPASASAVTKSAPPPPMLVESAVDVPAAPVSLSDLPVAPAPTVSAEMLATLPHTVAAVDDSDGLLTGAFKKTGSSIATAGTKAGTGLATAARVVGGAFSDALKKVWF
jgi:hypothetical protein